MNILILSLNYAPEPVGIGPYSAGMAAALVRAGHAVTVVCAKPYYPHWKTDPAFVGGGTRISEEDGVRVVRLPVYIPDTPSGRHRLLHHASFAVRAQPALLAEARRRKPDVVVAIAPSLIATTAARVTARLFGARLWLHVQDFEVEAAFATGLLDPAGAVGRVARGFEARSLDGDRVSSISPQMCAKLLERGIAPERVVEFRNWANIDGIVPLRRPSAYRAEWGITHRHVLLYSGNIANKQGIEILIDLARLIADRPDILIVICGNGPNRERLMTLAAGLDNVRFHDLQPMERMTDLLGLATIHLLPQIAGAADLVLPSKLANMLASGRPVVGTADPGTGLANEIEGCGTTVPAGDVAALAAALLALIDDPSRCAALGTAARARAEERWSRDRILAKFEAELRALAGAPAGSDRPH